MCRVIRRTVRHKCQPGRQLPSPVAAIDEGCWFVGTPWRQTLFFLASGPQRDGPVAKLVWLCQAVGMAKKRTKLDKLQRQADHLENKAETRPEQSRQKRPPGEDADQPAVPITSAKSAS